jgi:5'-nucleotidase
MPLAVVSCCAAFLSIVAAGCAVREPGSGIAPQAGNDLTLSIIGTNDLHGGILPQSEGYGGLALFSGYVQNLRDARRRDGGGVILLDAGDMFQGTLESNLGEGAAVVRIYNYLGYAAVAIGNHEFDFGPVGEAATPESFTDDPQGALKARAAEARFPFLAANLIDSNTFKPVDWPNVKPSTVIDVEGVKVGIIGVTTSGTLGKTMSANVRGLSMAPLVDRIREESVSLRAAGATVVIVAAHAGGFCRRYGNADDLSACAADEEIMDVAGTLPAGTVDAIVAGHTHAGMAHRVNGIPIVESFTKGVAFGRIDLRVDRRTGQVRGSSIFAPREICAREDPGTHRCDPEFVKGRDLTEVMYEGAPVVADSRMLALVEPDLARARALREERLGVELETPLRRSYGEESALGNLFADLMLAARSDVDVTITNGGGLRADLPAGPLTYGELYEAMPFDNRFATLMLTGSALRSIVDANLRSESGILSIAGMTVVAECVEGKLRTQLVRPDGRRIEDDDPVTLATSDFLATGGDMLFATAELPPASVLLDEGVPIRDAIASALRARGGRLRDSDLIDRARPRMSYPGERPVACRAPSERM